ncbi:MAG: protein translocase subunit SecD [Deltaproteobacteria bacterium]|nr:protein translocase subunit SecD [Deltaproteobacteria bacterium]
MERKWIGKVVFVLVLTLLAAVALITTVDKFKPGSKTDTLPEALYDLFPGINLGLDLQGGLRLIYEVEVEAAVEDKRDRLADAIIENLKDRVEITNVKSSTGTEGHTFDLTFASQADRESDEAAEILKEFRQSVVIESADGATAHMTIVEQVIENTKEISVKQAIETIGNRIDELGLVNTSVVPRGVDIIVEIPGVDEKRIERIKRIISTTARLEFKMVDAAGSKDFFLGPVKKALAEKTAPGEEKWPVKLMNETQRDGDAGEVQSYYLEARNDPKGKSGRQIIKEFLKTVELPENRSIGFQKKQTLDDAGNPTVDISWRTYYLERIAGITGDYVDNAMVLNDEQTGQPYVSLSFNQEGATRFGDLTEKNVKRHMAIVLDDKVNSAPIIQEKIGGGQARITLGGFEAYEKLWADAQDLVVVLRAGALPAPLKPVTETAVGPTLGHDLIAMGQLALIVAFIAVIIFMLVYYRGGGVAADIALIANTLFIAGILSAFGATLTLPGIAGIILTIGMAVDANVIIYERIREELRTGKSPRAAVDAGYKRAFWTIFDAQITTFIAGVVMLQYGTGAIKGFAVTLLIGIITSMFSAIFISRLFFDWMTRRRADQLSI